MSDDADRNGFGPIRVALEIRRFIDEMRIAAALPAPYRARAQGNNHYERIGGLTNRNYKIFLEDQALVLRLPGRGTGRFIDRATEGENQEAAAHAGFTPTSLFFDERTGVKLSEFIDDAAALTAEEARKPELCESVAAFLTQFHSSGLRFRNEFNVFRMAFIYERIARARRARFYDGFKEIRPRALALESLLEGFGIRRLACHNDLVPENIMVTPRGLTLIDWEYSGMNDPAWDVAAFLLESDYRDAEQDRFLGFYGKGEHTAGFRARVEAFKCLQDYLWSLWSLLQETASLEQQKARHYREYGQLRWERCIERLPAVERDLAAALRAAMAKENVT
jgi:thiamine kinase-like enzyme